MIDHGVRLATTGRTPAHTAAGAGELDLLRKLVDRGADLTTRDPDFEATPLTWARFIDRPHVVTWLEEHGRSGVSATPLRDGGTRAQLSEAP